VRCVTRSIVEVLSHDLAELVREKGITAYKKLLAPVIVEHGALYIDHLNGLPGPMVKFFWEKLDDKMPALIPPGASRRARVIQMVCFCDGKTLRFYKGRVDGTIATKKRGRRGIHWEPMFIPDGHSKTLGEMDVDERLNAQAFTQAYKALKKDLRL
jgi:XTP/dITP diphosphohydrolase